MDAFFSSVEQLTRPTLQGRPVLVGGRSGRGVVAGASYEARALGCHSAMPMHQAARLIEPRGVVVPTRGVVYRTVSRRIFRLLRTYVPVIEQLSVDEAFLEPAELHGCTGADVLEYCEMLRSVVREEIGLSLSFGAGSGKQYAKIGSGMAKPDGVQIIPASLMNKILRPLSVRKLWGVGPISEKKLQKENILTIGDLADLSEKDAKALLGSAVGRQLQGLARGFDNRPVCERAIAKQISSESTYRTDITDKAGIIAAIDDNGDDAHRRLLHDGRAARTVTVKQKLSDMTIISRSATLPYATTDIRTLLALAHRLALDPATVGACRLVGVGFSGLTTVQQESLFPGLDWEVNIEEERDNSDAQTVTIPGTTGQGVYGSERALLHMPDCPRWQSGMDVMHPTYGFGWIQGAGQGKVSVRFETRTSGPGRVMTFTEETADLTPADPLLCLDWPEEELHRLHAD